MLRRNIRQLKLQTLILISLSLVPLRGGQTVSVFMGYRRCNCQTPSDKAFTRQQCPHHSTKSNQHHYIDVNHSGELVTHNPSFLERRASWAFSNTVPLTPNWTLNLPPWVSNYNAYQKPQQGTMCQFLSAIHGFVLFARMTYFRSCDAFLHRK